MYSFGPLVDRLASHTEVNVYSNDPGYGIQGLYNAPPPRTRPKSAGPLPSPPSVALNVYEHSLKVFHQLFAIHFTLCTYCPIDGTVWPFAMSAPASPLHEGGDQNSGPSIIIVNWSLTVLALITVIARMWGRFKITRNAGRDDLCIVIAMVSNPGFHNQLSALS